MIEKISRFERRKQKVKNNEYFEVLKKSISEVISFHKSLSYLIGLKGSIMFTTKKGKFFMETELLDSVIFTLNSIKSCVKNGSLGDIYLLIRKMRDDLFLYLYFIETEERHFCLSDKITKHEKNAMKWMNNNLKNLYLDEMISYLRNNKRINKVIKKHNLKDTWIEIKDLLNNYVHTNGKSYAQMNYNSRNIDFNGQFREIEYIIQYITIVFLVLLILIKPYLVSSTNYVDALEVDCIPEEDSQYWVAPFIQSFIDKYINNFDPDLKEFLSDNTYMDID